MAVVHHAHEVPGHVAGLCVHAAVPGTHQHLRGAGKLNSLDIKMPEHPAPELACGRCGRAGSRRVAHRLGGQVSVIKAVKAVVKQGRIRPEVS